MLDQVEATPAEPIDERDDDRTVGRWTSWPLLVGLFLLAGVAWSLLTPPMGAPDEPVYSVHAAAFWSGQLDSGPAQHPDPMTLAYGNGRWFQLPEVWNAGFRAPCFAFQAATPASCASAPGASFTGTDQITDVPDSLTYAVQPSWMALTGWMGRLAPGVVGMYGMRLVSALAAAVLLAAAVRALAEVIPAGLALVAVLVAVTPTAWFMIGSVNPNGLEIAAAVATWAHALALARRPRRPGATAAPARVLVGLVVSCGLLVFARPLSPFFAGFALVVAAVVAGRSRLAELARVRRVQAAGGLVAAEVVVAAVLVLVSSHAVAGTDPDERLLIPGSSIRHVVEAIADFGWRDTPLRPVAVLWLVPTLGLVAGGFWLGRNRSRVALLITGLASGALLVVGRLPGAGGWQGRYGLPVLVGVALVAAVATTDGDRRSAPIARWFLPATAVVVGVANVGALYRAFQRFAIGLPASPLSTAAFRSSWQPVGTAVVPLALMLAFAALAVVVVVRVREPAA